MSFFKRFFGKRDFFFEIQESIITDPNGWSKEAEDLVYTLSQKEKDLLIKLCKILQKQMEYHYDFWIATDFTKEKFRNDTTFIYKSFFELLMIDFILICNSFQKKHIKDEIGQTLFLIIRDSLVVPYKQFLFSKDTFNNYEEAFSDRNILYQKRLTDYFSADTNKYSGASRFLFAILIHRPLSNEADKFGFSNKNSNGLINLDFLESSSQEYYFELYFSKQINKFIKEINNVINN